MSAAVLQLMGAKGLILLWVLREGLFLAASQRSAALSIISEEFAPD